MIGLKQLFRKKSASSKKTHCENGPPTQARRATAGDPAVDASLIDAALSGWFKQDTNELVEGFAIAPEDVVLDVGCGDSPFLEFCAMRGADVVFADIDFSKVAAMVAALEGGRARSVTPLVCDGGSLPLRDAAASKIIAMEVIEHVDDVGAFMQELVRVGKPGAKYLITAPDPVAETLQKELAPPSYFEKPNHVRILARDQFEQWVTDAGLVVEARKFYGFYWSIWWIFFWTCRQELEAPPHPLLESWTQTWKRLLETADGPKIKRVLDRFMPKSQAIIASKPNG